MSGEQIQAEIREKVLAEAGFWRRLWWVVYPHAFVRAQVRAARQRLAYDLAGLPMQPPLTVVRPPLVRDAGEVPGDE